MNISERLTALRKGKGLTQNELSKLSGLSRGLISQLESGVKEASKNIIEKLSSCPVL